MGTQFKFTFLFLLSGLVSGSQVRAEASAWNGRVFRVDASGFSEITQPQLIEQLAQAQIVVLGEKHNTPKVQNMQAKIVADTVEKANAGMQFTLAWEFLNYTDQMTTEREFTRFMAGSISGFEFLRLTQGSDQNFAYIPILQAVADHDGQLLGVNLSREQKAPVVRSGLRALDPRLLPPGFRMGGAGYRERFEEAMGGHATPDQMDRYFDAQCLTDDVMAYQMLGLSAYPRKFLVAGSFHTDYQDGTVARLKARAPDQPMKTVKIADASDFQSGELENHLREFLIDAKYGQIADFVVFVQ